MNGRLAPDQRDRGFGPGDEGYCLQEMRYGYIAFFPVNKSAGKTIWTMKVAASRQYDAGHILRSFQ